jgi:Ser/Thr protein kinase RdoA (MazF antagonist)
VSLLRWCLAAPQDGGGGLGRDEAAMLAAGLERAYGFAVGELGSVRGGESARAYVVGGVDGRRWFVKLTLPDPCYPRDARRLDAALRLTAWLRERVEAAEIVAPVPTLAGRPSARIGGGHVGVFPFLDARPLGARSGWSDAALTGVARAVGEMRRATAELGRLAPSTERFDLGYEAELPRALEGLERVERHRALGALARARPGPKVLCHTDLNGDNLLIDGVGRLYIVDWDELRLAPPEQDVRYLIDPPRLDLALRAYEEVAGPTPLEAETFGFYYYRRVLVDLAYFVCRILRAERSDQQDAHDLAIVRSDCFWAFDGAIERRIDGLRSALAARR